MIDNDIVLALVQDWGLKTVVEQLEIACERLANLAHETEEGEGQAKAWETDGVTLRRVLPLLINGDDEEEDADIEALQGALHAQDDPLDFATVVDQASSRQQVAMSLVDPPLNTAQGKLALIEALYRACAAGSESFEQDDMIGPDLAYLVGAICKGEWCEWPQNRRIIEIIKTTWPDASAPIWWYARVEQE